MSNGVRNELEQFKYALDQSNILAITDKRGVITYVNEKFCEISGYSETELIGKTHKVINSGTHDGAFWADLWATISSGQTWSGDVCNRSKNGELYWVDTTIVPFLDSKDQPIEYIAMRKDITDKKRTEAELELQKQKAMNSEKMAALGEMVAGIAHELGNPMGALRGRIEMVELNAKESQVSEEYLLDFCKRSTGIIDRMSSIIKGLQSYSRDASSDPFEQTNVVELAHEVLEFVGHKFRKNKISLTKINMDTEIKIECRGAEIGQVFLNLVSNSCDAVKDLPERWVKVELDEQPSSVIFRVIDSGDGIPEDVMQKMFVPFFTTKQVGEGTGLGLSISKKIVMSHQGRLECVPSSNTIMELELPLRQL